MNSSLAAETPIGDIVTAWPRLLRLMDENRLDYCCRGRDSLAAACGRAGVRVEDVLAEAASVIAAGTPDEQEVPETMTSLCDLIESKHHAYVRGAFARLAPLVARVTGAHGADHPELLAVAEVIDGLREEMLDHMVREERVLFPWLRRLEQPGAIHSGPPWSVKRPIDCMVHDHDAVSLAFQRLRALTNQYTIPADTCNSVAALMAELRELEHDTRRHIHLENNILFPAGVRAEVGYLHRAATRDTGRCDHSGCGSHACASAASKSSSTSSDR